MSGEEGQHRQPVPHLRRTDGPVLPFERAADGDRRENFHLARLVPSFFVPAGNFRPQGGPLLAAVRRPLDERRDLLAPLERSPAGDQVQPFDEVRLPRAVRAHDKVEPRRPGASLGSDVSKMMKVCAPKEHRRPDPAGWTRPIRFRSLPPRPSVRPVRPGRGTRRNFWRARTYAPPVR